MHFLKKFCHNYLNKMKITQQAFGKYTSYELKNEISQELVIIVPALGALVSKMILNDGHSCHKIMDAGTYDFWKADHNAYPNMVLFPWVNRTRNGTFSFDNKTYQLPINETGNNNALHGFVFSENFEIIENVFTQTEATLAISYQYNGQKEGFPFPFQLTITYSLHATGGFLMKTQIKNTGSSPLPCAFGWHPYFEFENETLADWSLKLPAKEYFMSDSQMIPMGTGLYNYNNQWNDLANKQYDTVFKINDHLERAITSLRSTKSKSQINVWQEVHQDEYKYAVIYTPPSKTRIAIEPMTGNTDALNNKQGLTIIEVGQSKEYTCGVNMEIIA